MRRILNAQKLGHAGTLDPLATGVLPIALGEATKTIPYAQDRDKVYRFTVKWGEARNTDDCEGAVIASSDKRPTEAEIIALLPRFTGNIDQTPPQFSAIKIDGERAYDLARAGEKIDMQSRRVTVYGFKLLKMAPRRGRIRARMRQRHLCALHRPGYGPDAGLLRPCHGPAPHRGREFYRRNLDFSGRIRENRCNLPALIRF